MIKSYQDLEIYKRSYKLGLRTHKLTQSFPKVEQYELASQLRRAAVSISLNIAEGYGRKDSAKEFKHFLRNAMGSSNEVLVLLAYTKDLRYISEKEHQSITEEYTILGKQINKLIQNWS